MLKKLVKFGNSTALVLDRAILELLNMQEGAVVKLKTDGTSLIITPGEAESTQTVFISNSAEGAAHMLHDATTDNHKGASPLSTALKARVKKNLATIEADVT